MFTISNMKTREIARNVKKIVKNNSIMVTSQPQKNNNGWSVNIGFDSVLKCPEALKKSIIKDY